HRAFIAEANVQRVGRLSIREALKLIRQTEGAKKKKKPDPMGITMTSMTDEQLTEALTALGFDRFNKVMPRAWVPQLERRLADQILSRLQQKRLPAHQIRKVHLRLVGGKDQHASH